MPETASMPPPRTQPGHQSDQFQAEEDAGAEIAAEAGRRELGLELALLRAPFFGCNGLEKAGVAISSTLVIASPFLVFERCRRGGARWGCLNSSRRSLARLRPSGEHVHAATRQPAAICPEDGKRVSRIRSKVKAE